MCAFMAPILPAAKRERLRLLVADQRGDERGTPREQLGESARVGCGQFNDSALGTPDVAQG